MWRVLNSKNNLTQNFGEFLKLAKMVVVHVIGLVDWVEDEYTFSSVGFLKSRFQNKLVEHIPIVNGMYFQIFLL